MVVEFNSTKPVYIYVAANDKNYCERMIVTIVLIVIPTKLFCSCLFSPPWNFIRLSGCLRICEEFLKHSQISLKELSRLGNRQVPTLFHVSQSLTRIISTHDSSRRDGVQQSNLIMWSKFGYGLNCYHWNFPRYLAILPITMSSIWPMMRSNFVSFILELQCKWIHTKISDIQTEYLRHHITMDFSPVF